MVVPLQLLPGPHASFQRFQEATRGLFDPSCYTVGGGTALEARWHHRDSTDVDLFVDTRDITHTLRENREVLREMLFALTTGSAERFQIGHDFVQVWLHEAPITLIADRRLTTTPVSDECVEGASTRLQSTEEILAKKIHLRILEASTLHPRDFYDMLCARELQPAAWKRAVANVTGQQWMRIRRALEPLCEDWGHYDDTLVRVAYPVIAGALKERSIALVSDELAISRTSGRETEREG